MGNQKKQIIIILIVFLLVILSYAGVKYYNRLQQSKIEEPTAEHTITSVSPGTVTGIEVANEQGVYHLEKKEENWINKDHTETKLDNASVEALLQTVENLTSPDLIEAVADPAEYGLKDPVITITVSSSDQESPVVISIGDYNELTGRYYLQLGESSNVYTTDSAFYSTWSQPADALSVQEEADPEVDPSADRTAPGVDPDVDPGTDRTDSGTDAVAPASDPEVIDE